MVFLETTALLLLALPPLLLPPNALTSSFSSSCYSSFVMAIVVVDAIVVAVACALRVRTSSLLKWVSQHEWRSLFPLLFVIATSQLPLC